MTHLSRLIPLALGATLLSACATLENPFGGGYPGPPMPGPTGVFFHAVGQEPGWTLDISPR